MMGKSGRSSLHEKYGPSGVINRLSVADHISGTGIFSKTETQVRA